jgi:DNA repair protein RadD
MQRFQLRPYQQAASDAAVDYLTSGAKGRHGLIVAPTGSGKSLLIADIVERLDGETVVFQPSREILVQNAAKLVAYGREPAVFSASLGRREVGQVTLATIGSVIRHPEAFKGVRYVLIDECHGVNAKGGMFKTFLDAVSGARFLGLTATPYRLATNSLGAELRFLTRTRPRVFRDLVHYTQIGDLFDDGFLCPVKYKQVPAIDHGRLKINSTGADWTDRSVQHHLDEIRFADRLTKGVKRLLAAGRHAIVVFTRFTDEAEALARSLGSVAAVVTAKTPARQRDAILDDFKAGRIQVVANVGIIALGFDFPRLDTVVLARPTRSLALYYQQVGRAIRLHPEKHWAAVVDMVGLVDMFGRIEDMELRPGGARGQKWSIWSGDRQLTNVHF